MKPIHILAMLIATTLIMGMLANEVYAGKDDNNDKGKDPKQPDAKVRAIQNGNSLDTENAGVLGEDIECWGGIGDEEANDFHCFLVPEGIGIGQYNWVDLINATSELPDGVVLLNTTQPTDCPEIGGLQTEDVCFMVNFGASNFTEGEWHFIGVFTKNGEVIDIDGRDWRVHSFMVVPEAIIGALAMIGAMFSIFIAYNHLKRNN